LSRILLVPMLPIKHRYSAWWHRWWEKILKEANFKVCVPQTGRPISPDPHLFTKVRDSIRHDLKVACWLLPRAKPHDVVVVLDAFWTGIPAIALTYLKLQVPSIKVVAYAHAGSYLYGDITSGSEGHHKYEEALTQIYDLIFVASEYHKKKLLAAYPKTLVKVVGFPVVVPPIQAKKDARLTVLASVRSIQKGLDKVETVTRLLKEAGLKVKVGAGLTQQAFWNLCARATYVISLAEEETFGLAVAEAVALNCIPIVPNKAVYPELYPPQNLYDSIEQIKETLQRAIKCGVPKLGDEKLVGKAIVDALSTLK